MKKYILSTLYSALVVPGLGQIINRNLKKGITILLIVFLLLVWGTIKLASIIKSLVIQQNITQYNSDIIMEKLKGEDLSSLLYVTAAFVIVWIYSVLDAFWTGRKMESQEKDDI